MSIQTKVGWRSFVVNTQTGIDTDAQAFITAASITDSTQQSAINTLVTQLKTYGIWTKLKAVYPFVGGTANSHKFNLKDPRDLDAAYRLVFNGGWVHSSTGAKPNGTNGYANTYLVPSIRYTDSNSISIGFYSRTNISENSNDIGSMQSELKSIGIQTRWTDNKIYGVCYDDSVRAIIVNNLDSTGFFTLSRTTTTSLRLYKNETTLGSYTNTVTGSLPTAQINLGSYNGLVNFSTREQALAFIGDGLSETETLSFYNAVQTFQTTLGRQVGVPIVSDTDAQAFLNAAVITDSTQASAITTLVTDLKSAGIWTKLKAVYPFVGGNATSHKFNLKDPRDLDAAYRLVFNGGWVHSSTGALPNGTTGYANTYLRPSTVQILNSNGFGYYTPSLNTTLSSDAAPIGTYTLNEQSSTMGYTSNNTKISSRLNYAIITSSTIAPIGLLSAQKTSNTLTTLYKNNTNVGSGTSGGSLSIFPFYFGTANVEGIPYSAGYVNHEFRLVYISDGLDSTDITNFYTAVQTFQTTLGRNVNTPIVADTDAQAFLNAAEITSQTQANAVNTLVTDLKSAGIWTKMKAIYPFVGGTATSHKFNLKDPRDLDVAYRLVFNGGWVHSSTGALPNGTTGYADTKLNVNNTLDGTNSHLSYYSRTTVIPGAGKDYYMMGAYDLPNSRYYAIDVYGANPNVYSSLGNFVNATDKTIANTKGLFLIKKESNNIQKVIINNTLIDTQTQLVTLKPNYNIGLAASINNSGVYGYSTFETAFASIGDGLSDAEATAFYTAVQKYQTSLGRQV